MYEEHSSVAPGRLIGNSMRHNSGSKHMIATTTEATVQKQETAAAMIAVFFVAVISCWTLTGLDRYEWLLRLSVGFFP